MSADGLVHPDELAQRQDRVVTAALRAAFAWSLRGRRPDAMFEIARMTGVVMEACGPAEGPTTPMDLVAHLHEPLGDLLAFAGDADEMISSVRLLEGDALSSAAHSVACEYVLPLDGEAEGRPWMPRWARMRADRIREQAFRGLRASRDQEEYVAGRRFLIENAAGSQEQIGEALSGLRGSPPVPDFMELPADRVRVGRDGTGVWWPCPECRWPMRVCGNRVHCPYRPHAARFHLIDGDPPELRRVDESGRGPVPEPRDAEGVVCAEPGIWRFVIVPGCTELRIARDLEALGACVELWPEFDAYDLRVTAGPKVYIADVKEYNSVHRLLRRLREKPPRAPVLLPRTHEHQSVVLRSALSPKQVMTETRLRATVRSATKGNR
ncbi:hypothetical protein [Actinocorallia sp. A-T 12471]|uniref:restriction endonuclease-related protein n=1 Tax=Actinocorallia sp. A-T 12471 TaxID=3089813 RepID=UPI0029CB1BC6|nr:hypothetical protein [Actinocorallia sp. A-T 12471]MDX6740421.1 hypothetical protein [Actinocorallia sp. A-T 12471]